MVNFNVEGLDRFGELGGEKLSEMFGTLGVLAVFFIILIAITAVILWVFGSVGLMNLGKRNKIPNSWLAFVPVGRSYLIGKLGFEVYGDKNNKNNTTFMWITLGLGAASFLLGDSNGDIDTLVKYGLLFFECWAFYNMFKNLNPKNSIVYTVFTALTGTLLGGLFLYLIKYPEENQTSEEVKETQEEKKKETKKEAPKSSFCAECGAKLNKEAKFCPECGNKVKKD